VRIPLFGVPKTAWKELKKLSSGGLILALWRVGILAGFMFAIYALAILGPGGVILGMAMFVITTLATWFWKDEIIGIAADIWNMEWAEVTV